MLAMERIGGLSRLIYSRESSGSGIPINGLHQPKHKRLDGLEYFLTDEEDRLFESAEDLSLYAQETNEKHPLACFTTKSSFSNAEQSVPTTRESKWFPSEAPGRLQTGIEVVPAKDLQETCKLLSHSRNSSSPLRTSPACFEPVDTAVNANQFDKLWRKLQKQRSWSTESSRNEAWERRRDLYLSEELKNMKVDCDSRVLERSNSDCGGKTWHRLQQGTRFRDRTLTDDDLEELRGCIDLGFGFGNKQDPNLCNTLPALELCYALERQLSSPSASDGWTQNPSLFESPLSSPESSWRVSTPGDDPLQVKTRLRHWAQAVACSVRQSCC